MESESSEKRDFFILRPESEFTPTKQFRLWAVVDLYSNGFFAIQSPEEVWTQTNAYKLDPDVDVLTRQSRVPSYSIGSNCKAADTEIPITLSRAVLNILESKLSFLINIL